MSQPDLFVVCKNCGSEVSPYVTECPYCGQRVRKRAPKLERTGEDAEPRAKQRRRPRLSRIRPDQIEGIAPDTRPTATIALMVVSLLVTLVLATEELAVNDVGGLVVGLAEQPWRYLTTPFVHDSLGYQLAALVAVGIFGSLLERRFGAVAVLLVFVAAGAGGAAAAAALDVGAVFESGEIYLVLGANGAALGLLAAWYADDRRAARKGADRENDLIGVYVIAAVLFAMPLAVGEANVVAGLAGAVTGAALGTVLPLFARDG